jgi:hypothetical protein
MVAACHGTFLLRSGSGSGAVADIRLEPVAGETATPEPVAS